jgi:hypothetical protein
MSTVQLKNHRFIPVLLLLVISMIALSSCAGKKESITVQQSTIDLALLQTLPEEKISYENSVKPILNNRCVVCHGCYDAPCAIINEAENDPAANLSQSVLYRMLRMKQITPQSRVGMLSDQIDLSLDRKQTCPTLEEFEDYQHKFPLQGMPFAMPNLKDDEYTTLVQWLAQGAPVPADKKPSTAASKQIKVWESFLNGTDLKQQLVSRYLYEHLFHGHLHIKGTDDREFYRMVRSRAPAGQEIDEIATVRPYGDPGGKFFYRLKRYPASIVAKSHVVYELSGKRLNRIKELFIKPDYQVTQLPSWDPETASNPFKAYAAIPPVSRYQFLLDDSRFFIEGFIKGPVCRGMIALNVIEDRFWVVFLDPETDSSMLNSDFLTKVSDYLRIPSSQEGNVRLFSSWKKYLKLEQEYVAKRFRYYEAMNQYDIKDAM